MAQFRGEVKWFNTMKGFGKLRREGSADVFCQCMQTQGYKTAMEGEDVEHDGEKGVGADKVRGPAIN